MAVMASCQANTGMVESSAAPRHSVGGHVMQTGVQIREARASLGWSAQQLAKRAHVPESTVKRAERSAGEPAITLEHLRKIRAALEGAGSQVTHRNRSCRSTASLTLVERAVGDRASGA
jgi:ribosome-binding protein aMBF1 (putative translation factor)